MAQPRGPQVGCYFSLDDGVPPGAVRTCGDPIRAHVHLNPAGGETLSFSSLRVNFKCKTRTLISTGSGNNRRLHKAKVYLFFFSTLIKDHHAISINSHQSWPVSFDFPWEVLPHPSQIGFNAPVQNPSFPNQPGHRLPPTWMRECRGHVQSVQYYLEAVMTRHGRMMDHTDKKVLQLTFSPPLDLLNPPPEIYRGLRGSIVRSSRLLDPEKREEHYGFRERTKHLFSNDTDPVAMFTVSASAPRVCCRGDTLPVTLHVEYNGTQSTAPKQPELKLKSVYIRVADITRYRVSYKTMFMDSNLERESETKITLANRSCLPPRVVYDGMALNDFVEIGTNLPCSFATFTINCSYILKISGIFECAGKDFDLVLLRHLLTVHPSRELYRALPPGIQSPPPPAQQANMLPPEEVLPPYMPSPSGSKPPPPSYDSKT